MGDYYGQASKSAPTSKPTGGIDQGKIFVGGLSWQTTEESLRWHFEQYGPVVSVEVMRDRVTGDPRGFAFVVFQESSTVDLIMKETHEINHKVVDVKRAQARGVAPPSIHGDAQPAPREQSQQPQQPQQSSHHSKNTHFQKLSPEQLQNKVFVGGLPPSIVERDELQAIFEPFGPVVDAIVMVDTVTNRSRCFGFVTFAEGSQGAQSAIAAQPLPIQGRNVEVKLATPKSEQGQHGGGAGGGGGRKGGMSGGSAGPKHIGLRAGILGKSSLVSNSKYSGLAVAYGRNGWKAGYGTYAFGPSGWAVQGWEGRLLDRSGFSFDLLYEPTTSSSDIPPPSKRARY